MQCRPHRKLLVTNEHLLSVHMCTALNLAVTERAGGGGGESKESGGVCIMCWGGVPPGFPRKVVSAGAARRVSLQRGLVEGAGV